MSLSRVWGSRATTVRLCVLLIAATFGFTGCGSSEQTPAAPTPAPSPSPQPQPVASLSRIEVTGSAVLGGGTLQGSVTLSSEAPPGGTTVTLSSNNDVVTVPATVAVAGGATRAEFVVSTRAVTADADVTVTGTSGGEIRTATVRVQAIGIVQLTLARSEVGGLATSLLTVQLNAPAPQGGITVRLVSSHPAAAEVTSTVEVRAGQISTTWNVQTWTVPEVQDVTITARVAAHERWVGLRVLPRFLAFAPPPDDFVTGGQGRRLEYPTHNVLGSGSSTFFTLRANSRNGGNDNWSVDLRSGSQRPLAVGRFVITPGSPNGPSIGFSGQSRGCSGTSGEFEVHQIGFAANGDVIKLHVTLSLVCGRQAPTIAEFWFAA